MFKTNEYFEGNVKSIAFETDKGTASIGAMHKGEYEFSTTTVEHMTVTSGEMLVKFANSEEWFIYKPFETFIVDKDSKFKVKTSCDTTYRCIYK